MKSAYAILGIPGNASEEDIRQAYERAANHYSKDKLLDNPSLAERVVELKEAYKILSTPDLRQMHDRKLSAAVELSKSRTTYESADAEPSKGGWIKVIALVVVAMFAIGTYNFHIREEARKAKLAQEIALKKQADEEAAKAAREQAAAEAARSRADAIAENRERQLRSESATIGRQVMANQAMAVAAQERQANADRNAELQAERQRKSEAQQRAAENQRQLRNLCMMNYGRPNC